MHIFYRYLQKNEILGAHDAIWLQTFYRSKKHSASYLDNIYHITLTVQVFYSLIFLFLETVAENAWCKSKCLSCFESSNAVTWHTHHINSFEQSSARHSNWFILNKEVLVYCTVLARVVGIKGFVSSSPSHRSDVALPSIPYLPFTHPRDEWCSVFVRHHIDFYSIFYTSINCN